MQRTAAIPDTVELECYTDGLVFSGSVRCPIDLRLIDLFNGKESNSGGEFLHLFEASGGDKTTGTEQDVFIKRSSIRFAAITDADIRRGVGADHGRRLYPFVNKLPVAVTVRLPEYTLTGRLHCCHGQTIEGVLNDSNRFLPLTAVTIIQGNRVYGSRPFVAVNREHIIWSAEETFLDRSS